MQLSYLDFCHKSIAHIILIALQWSMSIPPIWDESFLFLIIWGLGCQFGSEETLNKIIGILTPQFYHRRLTATLLLREAEVKHLLDEPHIQHPIFKENKVRTVSGEFKHYSPRTEEKQQMWGNIQKVINNYALNSTLDIKRGLQQQIFWN